MQIKRRISKLKLHSEFIEDINDLETAEANTYNKQQMTLEMEKSNPSIVKLKQFLDATRATRAVEVNTTPALLIISQYPSLKRSDLV